MAATGPDHSPAAFLEHAETHLRGVFGFLGVTNVEVIAADGTSVPNARAASIENAAQRAAALAI